MSRRFDRSWLLIDRDALDDEIVSYPERFHVVSLAVSDAQSVRDERKDELDRVAADLDAVVRDELREAGEKDTNEKVKARIAVHEKYVKARDAMHEATRRHAQAASDRDAMQQKSYMLRALIDLYAANYYSTDMGAGARRVTDGKAQRNKSEIAAGARSLADRRRDRARVKE